MNESLIVAARSGDTEAYNELFKRNDGLVWYIANRFASTDIELEELHSIALLGMVKAYRSFDASKEILFATYATRCMSNEILMFVRNLKKSVSVISLNEVFNVDSDGHCFTYQDILTDDSYAIDDILEQNENKSKVLNAIDSLTQRKKEIIKAFYIDGKSQKEIARDIGISQPSVSRTRARVIRQLKMKLHSDIVERVS